MFLVQIMKKSLIFHGMNDLSTFVSLHTLQIKELFHSKIKVLVWLSLTLPLGGL